MNSMVGLARASWAVSSVAAALVCAGLGGCVAYNTYPKVEGYPAFSNPNDTAVQDLMTVALTWVIQRYPPTESAGQGAPAVGVEEPPGGEAGGEGKTAGAPVPARLAINLPPGMRHNVYQLIVKRVGQGAVPLTPETENLPTYHVVRVWAGGDEAKVDIVRPVLSLGTGPDGKPVYQALTVKMRGGLQYWRVTSHRVWSIGAVSAPPPNYVPQEVRTGVSPANP